MAALRWLVILAAACGVLLGALVLAGVTRAPLLGINVDGAIATQPAARVTLVGEGSGAARAGLVAGDRIRLATPEDAATYAAHVRGSVVHLVRNDGAVVAIPLEPLPLMLRPILFLAIGMLMCVLAIVLGLRAWTDVQARWLALGFVWIAYYIAQTDASDAWRLPLAAIGSLAIGAGTMALVFFATGWDATPAGLRRLRPLAVVLAAALCIAEFVSDDGAVWASRASTALWLALIALMLAGLGGSLAVARGVDRRRIGWILVTMTVAFVPIGVVQALLALHAIAVAPTWVAVAGFALPIGFGYATLRHRVVDLGFALNRAAVFAATTALMVGLFGGMQWAAEQSLEQMTRAQGYAVQLAITVILLYAFRALRAQADALVTRLFFATRQRRIAAIAALGRAVEAVESPASVGPYVVEQLRADTGIDASLYVDGDDAYVRIAGDQGPSHVSRDNPTVIALRATGLPAAIRAESDLIGAIAFPLAVRGRLRGALVCALPSRDEEFAPDEEAALADLAARTCVVREDLLAEELRAEHAVARAALARLTGGAVLPFRGGATSPHPAE